MFLIDYVIPEKATGAVKDVYSVFPTEVGIPAPVQLYSASEDYLLIQMGLIKTLKNNDAYEPALLAALRFMGASENCFGFCTMYNRDMLKKMGLSDNDVDDLGSDPSQAFEPKEAAMITLVTKAITTPDKVVQSDIDAARTQGWTDKEIFECTAYAAQMKTLGTIYRAFSKK